MDKDTWYYDGVKHHGNCIVGNVVPGDTCNPNYKDNAIKELGTIKAIITSLSNPNYELPKEETTHNLSVIGAAVANVTMNPDTGTQQLIYNGQVQSGLISSSGVAISGQDTAIDAGNYTLTATPLPGYAWDKEGTDTAPRDFVWTIHQKVADIEWGQTEWVYDGVEHSTTCTVKNVDEYTPCKVLISNNHIVDVGTQPVTATLENVNYAFPNNTVRDNVLKVTTANDATFVMNDPVTYDEKTHKWGTGEHIVVTGTLEETEAGTYTVTIVPTANHAWADGTTTPITKTWIINNAKMASVSWDDYNFTGKNIVGVKLCDAQVGTCFSCGYQGAIPMVDYHGDPTKYMILHCPACGNENQSEFEVTGGYVSGSTYASYGVGQYQAISPGQYQVVVKPNKNYAWIDGSTDEKPITWNILSNTVVKPSIMEPLLLFANPITTYEYNGKVRSPMVSTMDGTLPLSDSYFTNNAYFTVTGTRSATDAGNYTATISLKNKATSQWQDGTKDDLIINWTITKRKITVATIPHLGERTYTDMRLFPAATNSITKQVAYEKNWDGLTFESNFNVPATLTKDVDGDDILMTKDNIIDYHFDCLPDERETEPVAANQTIYFTITDATKAYSSAGVHEYAVTAIVKDASNKNVSNNYQITYNYAWLMIHQVAIKASDITPPTAKTLTYNGNNQDLVVAGKCPYGVLEYTMDGRANTSTTENWTAYNGNNWSTLNGTNNTGWSKTIPQGKYAGQYKIYWRVDADQNHFDYTNHPNSGNIDKVDVTIQRAPQNVTLSYYSTTFCYHNISRSFNVTGRYENATFTPLTTSGPVSANQSNTNVTVYSSDSYGQGTGRVTVHTAQTANYQAGSVTFTANISDHSWVYDNTTRPWPDCTKNGTNHYHCGYDCGATTTSSVPPLAHNSVYGGTRDCHTKCSKCGGTLTGYSSHSFSASVIKAATHTTAGTTRYTCACGYSYTVSGRPAATGHNYSYGGWYYQSGQHHARNCTCSCGHSYIEAQGHTIVYEKSGCCYRSSRCRSSTGYCGSSSAGSVAHHGWSYYYNVVRGKPIRMKKCHCGYIAKA